MGDDVVACNNSGKLGRTLRVCKGVCKAGACVETCAINDIEFIYVVDSANDLLRFDPRKLPGDPFKVVGKIDCGETTTPFSMAIDREGIAWVLYHSGLLYRVSILDAHCSAVGLAPNPNPTREYSMAFVSDGPKGTTEKLFVAANDDSRMLARIDLPPKPLVWKPIAPITAKQTITPDLTGTDEGRLFGYFPEQAGFIQELDRSTGKLLGQRWPLPKTTGDVEAYAFAHWGSVFYVFATVDKNSAVHAIHRQTGQYELVRDHLPYRITGAGVSTCAPQLER